MKHLILDQFSLQPLYKRCIWTALTAVGWGLWIYLWKPLFGSFEQSIDAGVNDGISTPQAIDGLLGTLMSHGMTVIGLVALFVLWSVLQSHGIRKRSMAKQEQTIGLGRLANSVNLHERDLSRWQQAQRMVVMHDEDAGWICGVDVLGATTQPA